MKYLKLLALSSFALCAFPLMAQQEEEVVVVDSSNPAPQNLSQNKFYGMNQNYVKFTSDQKKFNDWSVGVYAGLPFIQGADLNTYTFSKSIDWVGYDFQGVLTKQITHAFGLGLQLNYGKTEQYASYANNRYSGHTNYWMWSLQGDLNFSNLLRRVDNKSRFAWALHGYLGVGTLQYKAYINKNNGAYVNTANVGGFGSMVFNSGVGLRYKVNQRLDVEAKAMYYFTGDEEFDGSTNGTQYYNNYRFSDGEKVAPLANLEEGKDDGLLTFSVGTIFKLGKHYEHLAWADPLADLYPGLTAEDVKGMLVVCNQGDKDDDGVCDDWDRELNTPAGARVDGAGRALDTDLDGIIDLNDKCVTLPGPASNSGCPLKDTDGDGFFDNVDKCPKKPGVAPDGCPKVVNIEEVKKTVKNINVGFVIEFAVNKAVIRPESYYKLDEKAKEIKDVLVEYPGLTLFIDGYTSNTGSATHNQKLSERRAQAVVRALEQRGISRGILSARGFGEEYPKCSNDTPEGRQCNRRVEVSVNRFKM